MPTRSVAIIAFAQVMVTNSRVKHLLGELRAERRHERHKRTREIDPTYVSSEDSEEEENEEVNEDDESSENPKQGSKPVTITGRMQIQDTVALLQGTKLLDMTDSTVREKIGTPTSVKKKH